MSVSQERFLQLLSRKMAGEATIQELAELEDLMHESEEQRKFAERILINQPGTTEHDEHEADAAFAAHSVKMQLAGRTPKKISSVRGKRTMVKWTMRIAAVIIIAVAGIYTFKWFGKNNEPALTAGAELATAMGRRSSTVLPDGTTVWLNAGSKLSYEKDFGRNSREVTLTGEAFFDVVKQSDRPFIVHASGIDIKVLGTAFNVKSYPEDKTVETTLFRGLVEIFRPEESEKKAIRLQANEKLILSKKTVVEQVIPTIAHIDSSRKENERSETAWIYNRLEFRGDSFEELAKKMERWYNVTIVFTDEKVKELKFYGTFQNETVEEAFSALKTAFPIRYTIKNHEIFIGSSQ